MLAGNGAASRYSENGSVPWSVPIGGMDLYLQSVHEKFWRTRATFLLDRGETGWRKTP